MGGCVVVEKKRRELVGDVGWIRGESQQQNQKGKIWVGSLIAQAGCWGIGETRWRQEFRMPFNNEKQGKEKARERLG